mmetsp:Transcript_83483/g.234774  ORF Transcript_83483/g.234774 Transcript_83483/m.234774 type:complete len:234 (-) Transcript_83483:929-1630(-)
MLQTASQGFSLAGRGVGAGVGAALVIAADVVRTGVVGAGVGVSFASARLGTNLGCLVGPHNGAATWAGVAAWSRQSAVVVVCFNEHRRRPLAAVVSAWSAPQCCEVARGVGPARRLVGHMRERLPVERFLLYRCVVSAVSHDYRERLYGALFRHANASSRRRLRVGRLEGVRQHLHGYQDLQRAPAGPTGRRGARVLRGAFYALWYHGAAVQALLGLGGDAGAGRGNLAHGGG